MFPDLPGQVDQSKANGFEALASPTLRQNQIFHGDIEIQGKDHNPPPGRILAKFSRREFPASQIVLHDGMNFFAFTAALTVPPDQFVAIDRAIGNNPANLVTLTARGLNLIGLFAGFASGQFQLVVQ